MDWLWNKKPNLTTFKLQVPKLASLLVAFTPGALSELKVCWRPSGWWPATATPPTTTPPAAESSSTSHSRPTTECDSLILQKRNKKEWKSWKVVESWNPNKVLLLLLKIYRKEKRLRLFVKVKFFVKLYRKYRK